MGRVGYVVPVDAVSPREAVDLARLAEQAGFSGVMAADIFQPWLPSLGQAPNVWPLLGALAEHTTGDFGAGMVAAGGRQHPAAIAQAAATLAALHPGRHWLSLGGGEALHEHVTGGYWPEAPERIARLFEAVDLIKRLFAGSLAGRDVRYEGERFQLESARLWTMPERAPSVLVATSGPVTARRAGRQADGLLAVAVQPAQAAQVLERFREGAREVGKDPATMPAWLHLNVSWAATDDEAAAGVVERYPMAAMRFARGDLRSPHVVEQIAKLVRPEDFPGRLPVSADPAVHLGEIKAYLDLGFDRVFVHHVGVNQVAFLEAFGRDVLPYV
ncbi:TIGR03557 family F420-dependent LLM class oxidoreductase [Nocardioides daphniae]|uniref:LLM class F420-dependent oxidoreductase n=1 Tax=Nocardioides daphniae TaxID=402297 RepID=A0A4V1CW89_9ACTN|nr:TIGR03557 family F420-dependent LLM class oxidoreductase [Nocardioides daphniae]QCC76427.1 TIGR03557 family F420-dependent LLM class oxidoreductase [Nocardioides daphniae]GGD06834.1 LLM class F420-dependent oxidoreductase [Nocardioides daphniae]